MAGISATILSEFKNMKSSSSTDSLSEDFEKLMEHINKIKKVVLLEHPNPTFKPYDSKTKLCRQIRTDRWYSIAQTLALSENIEIVSEQMKIRARKVDGYIKLYDSTGVEQSFMYEVIN